MQRAASFALLLMDLDQFRQINGTFGHYRGDQLLQQVGSRVRNVLRGADFLVRLGGDEFGILLSMINNDEGAIRIARRILKALEDPFLIEDHPVRIGSSIGIVRYPEHGTDADLLLRRADIAMYQAKQTGLGYARYVEAQNQYSPERLTLTTEFRHALDQNQLTLYFQPKVRMVDGQVWEVEALSRWQHPERGLLSPDQFVPLAEQTGLIHPFSLCVLQAALRRSKAWHRKGFTGRIAVNLSMHNLQGEKFPIIVEKLIKRSGWKPQWLSIEVTESAMAADPDCAVDVLSRLRAMGLWIAVDDFGTGYASFAAPKQLPVDEIKIDKSFVLGITSDAQDAAIARATIDLGQALGLIVTAEGVEGKAEWDCLADWGCDVAQGYYCSPPVPAAELLAWTQAGLNADTPLQKSQQGQRRTAVG